MVGSTMISTVFSIRRIFDGEPFSVFPPFALRVNIGCCSGGGGGRRSCRDFFRGRSCCRRCGRRCSCRNFFCGCSGSGCSGSGCSGSGCCGYGVSAMELSN